VAVPYAEFADPQSLNLYTYVRNVPTTRLDADGHCTGNDCNKITVSAKVEKQAEIKDGPRGGGKDSATVGGEITYTLKYDNKPLENTAVHEDVKTTTYMNGEKTPAPVETGTAITNKQGQMTDETATRATVSNPSNAGPNKASQALSQNVITKNVTQTLSFESPNGATCAVTETRQLTNAGPSGQPSSHYEIKLTSPLIQTARPADGH
jgi:hypothetical protein